MKLHKLSRGLRIKYSPLEQVSEILEAAGHQVARPISRAALGLERGPRRP